MDKIIFASEVELRLVECLKLGITMIQKFHSADTQKWTRKLTRTHLCTRHRSSNVSNPINEKMGITKGFRYPQKRFPSESLSILNLGRWIDLTAPKLDTWGFKKFLISASLGPSFSRKCFISIFYPIFSKIRSHPSFPISHFVSHNELCSDGY